MATQDDIREREMRELFELEEPPGASRAGLDAILHLDGERYEFELKSCTNRQGSVSTARDVGKDHIAKWRPLHWLFGFYQQGTLRYCIYAPPEQMKTWIDDLEEYMRPDFFLAERAAKTAEQSLTVGDVAHALGRTTDKYTLTDAKRIAKKSIPANEYCRLADYPAGCSPQRVLDILADARQVELRAIQTLDDLHNVFGAKDRYARHDIKEGVRSILGRSARLRLAGREDLIEEFLPTTMLKLLVGRAKYVADRGATLNNPHIGPEFFRGLRRMTSGYAQELRKQVRDWKQGRYAVVRPATTALEASE